MTTMTRNPTTTSTPTHTTRKGWHSDPEGLHDLRFHDGSRWTEHVTHFGPVPCRGCAHAA
jgi:hypothetical protein